MNIFLLILFGLSFKSLNAKIETPAELSSNIAPYIVGGQDTTIDSAPHMVALLIMWIIPTVFCGASIIHPRLVLTAAHCIDAMKDNNGELSKHLAGRVGSNTWSSGGTLIYFTDYKNHNNWDPVNVKNDAGILITASSIELNEKVALVPVYYGWLDGGVDTVVTGYGRLQHGGSTPQTLQMLKVTTIPGAKCEWLVRIIGGGHSFPVDVKSEICTLHSPGHGMCNGDSGGPLLTEKERKQIGVVSWGFPCAVGAPDVFTRTYVLKDLIEYGIRTVTT